MKLGEIVMNVASFVVATGVSMVVGNAVKFTTPVTQAPIEKVLTRVGAHILGAIAGDQAVKYITKEGQTFKTKEDEPIVAPEKQE